MKAKSLWIVGAIFVALLPSEVASADTASDSASFHLREGVREPLPEEIADTAMARGISLEESKVVARLQLIAQELRPIARSSDAGYLGIWVDDSGTRLVYASEDPARAKSIVAGTSFSDSVVVSKASASERELEATVAEVARAIDATEVGIEGTGGIWVDKGSAEVVVDVPDINRSQVSNALSLLDPLSSLVRLDSVPLSATLSEGASLKGGGNATTCTWGFTVIHGGQRRMVTAGHCGNTQSWYGNFNMPMVSGAERNSGDVDAQIHTVPSPHTADDSVIIGNGLLRDIASRGTWSTMDVGDSVCHTGKTTGFTCGTISSVNGAQAVGGGTHVLRATGSNLKAQPGDSGGPVFWGTKALGLYEGQNGSNPPNALMIWTAINYAEAHFNMTVATS